MSIWFRDFETLVPDMTFAFVVSGRLVPDGVGDHHAQPPVHARLRLCTRACQRLRPKTAASVPIYGMTACIYDMIAPINGMQACINGVQAKSAPKHWMTRALHP
eukprot:2513685-Rhodomonas_salina.3